MITKFLPSFRFAILAFAGVCFSLSVAGHASANNTPATGTTVTDLKQKMGKNRFWMTMRVLPPETSIADARANGVDGPNRTAKRCLLAYIEKPRFRKKIKLAFILSAEKDKFLVQSGSAEWNLPADAKGSLDLHAGHWTHHFNMKQSKFDEITATMPEEEMGSLLNTLSRNNEGTLDYSSGKFVTIPLKDIAPELDDFKSCVQANHFGNVGEPTSAPAKGKRHLIRMDAPF
ncbi:hypothetical protein FAI40_04090 [Acetobacteraceae bacterium]|nr:hypothetical protein FAI40_04090 [Acetobacteraceae bacterium]